MIVLNIYVCIYIYIYMSTRNYLTDDASQNYFIIVL